MATEERQGVCSFCGLPSSEHRRLIQGDNCFICDVCVGICYQMINLNNHTHEDEEEIIKPAKKATATTDEPFEFFVDFDEPDMSEPPITDADLYADAPTGKKALRS
jgi:hypothetical protein